VILYGSAVGLVLLGLAIDGTKLGAAGFMLAIGACIPIAAEIESRRSNILTGILIPFALLGFAAAGACIAAATGMSLMSALCFMIAGAAVVWDILTFTESS